jgi:hypothetical protein
MRKKILIKILRTNSTTMQMKQLMKKLNNIYKKWNNISRNKKRHIEKSVNLQICNENSISNLIIIRI